MKKKIVEIKPLEAGQRLDRWIKQNHPEITFVFLQKLLRKGGIKVAGKKAKPAQVLEAGQKVEIIEFEQRGEVRAKFKPEIPASLIEDIKKAVIYKDENVIVINKPAGLAAQGGSKVRYSVDGLLDHLKFGKEERPKLVHRIDKDTSGIMLLARHTKAAALLTRMFKEKEVKKVYWALTKGVPKKRDGKITAPLLAKKNNGRIEKTAIDEELGKKAVTNYRVLDKAGEVGFLELEPITGRMHQIRAHLVHIECPVLGDGKYGGREAFINGIENKMHLHARYLRIDDLFGKRLEITADLPKHMEESFKMLGFSQV